MTDVSVGRLLEEVDLSFPDRNDTLLPTDRSKAANPRSFDGKIRVLPKTSLELGGNALPTLHQFFPAWEVQAYARFAQIKLHMVNARYPEYEATGMLPQLNDGHFLVPTGDIILHLQTYYKDLDANLSDKQRAESVAFRAIVQEKLARVLDYCQWVDPITYSEVTRPAVQRVMPFPLNRIVPKLLHARHTAAFHASSSLLSKEHVYLTARDSYVALNSFLEESANRGSFFFGDEPSALDAVVFGHVVDALSDGQLREVIAIHGPRLVQFATHVRDVYFDSAAHAALCSQNTPNAFANLDAAFLTGDFNLVPHAAYVAPFHSLSWSQREVVKASQAAADPSTAHDAVVTYDKSTRNVLLGGFLAILLYGLSQLSISIEDDDDDFDDDDALDDD
ncbi:hypothetical protein H310_01977 [Aphanomyces invadans]|uniref:GST C-terminal domain-containing protein n=1 Tax=Aphanomyces invadans TaxID=157072 RepID=A0A024UMS9_9STRA|nr:hypothetical protein H310_01977 [Aphanomyces invadans]ETW07465.1 hypothetical protein H310_01977 [Aphanomyces invadans]|eukprot:XP_008863558.1 hypothetical protein H310_01977 [Aphanomyces invadans]